MSSIGIISEFNPLHNGHEYAISKARQQGADGIVCVMSGNATQRGELTVADKYARAEAAILCGADLVLELPYPWCASSAEYFGAAGVAVAKHFCDSLLFGSECGDIDLLWMAARICESDDFKGEFLKRTQNGEGAASAYCSCLEERGVVGLGSNDLLGLSYIRAIIKQGSSMRAVTVKRQGADYNCEDIEGEGYRSASAIRAALKNGNDEAFSHMPMPMQSILRREEKTLGVTDTSELDSLLLGFFRLADPDELERYADCGGGIAHRICDCARATVGFDELLERLSTKRYTDAKLRRAILYCVTGVLKDDLSALPSYTTLLAANKKGRALLSKNRRSGGIQVVTKQADSPRELAQYNSSKRLDELWSLARVNKLRSDELLKRSAFILDR